MNGRRRRLLATSEPVGDKEQVLGNQVVGQMAPKTRRRYIVDSLDVLRRSVTTMHTQSVR